MQTREEGIDKVVGAEENKTGGGEEHKLLRAWKEGIAHAEEEDRR